MSFLLLYYVLVRYFYGTGFSSDITKTDIENLKEKMKTIINKRLKNRPSENMQKNPRFLSEKKVEVLIYLWLIFRDFVIRDTD